MTPQKRGRLVAAITVNIVLLLVILVAVMIYQLVTIFVLKDKKDDIEDKIAQLTEETETMEHDIEYYQTEQGILDLLVEYGLYN